MGYLGNFMVYTLAMVGVMFVALMIFKKTTSFSGAHSSKHLKVIDSISLGQRKMLYIVSAGNEKFLIAGDAERTSLISKLNSHAELPAEELCCSAQISEPVSFKETLSTLPKQSYMDRMNVGITSSLLNKKTSSPSVMKNLADIMKNK